MMFAFVLVQFNMYVIIFTGSRCHDKTTFSYVEEYTDIWSLQTPRELFLPILYRMMNSPNLL